MSIGTGVVLFIVGAILAFGLELDIPGVNDDFIGYLFMGAGVVVFVLGLIFMTRRRSAVERTRTTSEAAPGQPVQGQPAQGQQVTERRTDVDPL